jgi:hypothetical protein
VLEMLRCAKEFGVKARTYRSNWQRLIKTPLPGIAVLRDSNCLLLGKASEDQVLVQDPLSPRPILMSRAEFEAIWDGRLKNATRRAIGRVLTIQKMLISSVTCREGDRSQTPPAAWFAKLFAQQLENRGVTHLPIDPPLIEWLQTPVLQRPVTSQGWIAIVYFADQLRYRSPAELSHDFAPHVKINT